MLLNRPFILARAAEAVLLFLFALPAALAQIPAAPNCTVNQPPPDAGLYATPGGFLMVHPRNAGLSDGYTGCKTLWVVDTPDRFIRMVTLYFEQGRLRVAQSYNKDGSSRGTCTLPGQSAGCEGVDSNPLTALRMPTWPRMCMDRPNDPQCAKEPD
jgi:hypothetical protein